ncbi:hypothetical protein G8770_04115 [Aestuariicella hydrocarbonica]|uniref:Uncharacterized protein n=1 Tax=Pseudomaricurvus hydrocarbonicus TaxID=1470433 RepID=A0A9E5MLV1_9GAMM|nr:hypothetical protein [Aestuariicella hydrocarbonica]NHO64730.1 hypothetical protein [Aestuariicella hydrocarbonica]
MAEISFRYSQNCSGNREEKDQKVSLKPIWELINSILDSLILTLSPENQAKVDQLKAECPDYTLSESFPPLTWPVETPSGDASAEPLKIHAS